MDARVRNDVADHRYVIDEDGEVAGFVMYRDRPGLIAFVHTEIDPRFEGRGLGGALVSSALDDARGRELVVLPFCPFVNAYIQRHPEYQDLVPDAYKKEFGL
jgi:uncharacterized protein